MCGNWASDKLKEISQELLAPVFNASQYSRMKVNAKCGTAEVRRPNWLGFIKEKNIFIRKCSGKPVFSSGELFIDIHRVYIKLLRVRVARTCIPLF